MTTRILDARADPGAIDVASAAIQSGDLVAIPTETVYGLAANALDAVACAKIFEAKARPLTDPLIVHVLGITEAEGIAEFSDLAHRLAQQFWPGPLTLVLPRRAVVPDLVTAGGGMVAIRSPRHPITRSLLERCGRPLAAPSANRFGRISPTSAAHVLEELGGRIPIILDGGPCSCGIESTIVRVDAQSLSILRDGPITRDELAEIAPLTDQRSTASTPGSMKSHYAPATPLEIATDSLDRHRDQTVGLLAWQPVDSHGFGAVEILSTTADLREAAANLYAAMRRLDGASLSRIVAIPVPEIGIGIAIQERLLKAAAAHE